jgi:hypothetical protein
MPPELKINPSSVTCSKLNENVTIQVRILDGFKISGIDFEVKYNTTLLKVNAIQWCDLSGFLPGPYITKTYSVDELNGVIRFVLLENLTTGAPLASGDRSLVNITFMAIKSMIWKSAPGWTNLMGETLIIDRWNITVNCPEAHFLTGELVHITNGNYSYVPIKGDVDSNGLVDIFDLAAVATYYNVRSTDPQYIFDFDLNNDNIIDVFDLVLIARNFGYRY